MTTITKNIRQYFETHIHVDVLFFTNDHLEENGGDRLAFFKEETANVHAKNLQDKTVVRITRTEAFADAINNAVITDETTAQKKPGNRIETKRG